jgi:hypothetical protein
MAKKAIYGYAKIAEISLVTLVVSLPQIISDKDSKYFQWDRNFASGTMKYGTPFDVIGDKHQSSHERERQRGGGNDGIHNNFTNSLFALPGNSGSGSCRRHKKGKARNEAP